MQHIRVRLQYLFIIGAIVYIGTFSNVSYSVPYNLGMTDQKLISNNIYSDQYLDSRFNWYEGLWSRFILLSDADEYNLDEDLCDEIVRGIEAYFGHGVLHLNVEIFALLKRHEKCTRVQSIAPVLREYLNTVMDIAVEEDVDKGIFLLEVIYRVLRLLVHSPVITDPMYAETINRTEKFREIIEGLRPNGELSKPNYCAECNKPFFIQV